MAEAVIGLLTIFLTILWGIFRLLTSRREKERHEQEALDKAFERGDTDYISVELDAYYRRLREKNSDSTR